MQEKLTELEEKYGVEYITAMHTIFECKSNLKLAYCEMKSADLNSLESMKQALNKVDYWRTRLCWALTRIDDLKRGAKKNKINLGRAATNIDIYKDIEL